MQHNRQTTEQLLYSRGAAPPEDGKPLTWANSAFDEPNVLGLTLERLDSLYLEEYVSSAVVSNLGKALDEYCPTLVAEGVLPNCDPPTPDPPLPNPRIWSHWSNFGEGDDFRAQVKHVLILVFIERNIELELSIFNWSIL